MKGTKNPKWHALSLNSRWVIMLAFVQGPVHTTPEELENEGIKRFAFFLTLRRRNLKTQKSPVILDLCSWKPRAGKSRDHRNAIVFETLRFQNLSRPHENERPAFSNSSGLKSGLVMYMWTVRLTAEKRAAFSNSSRVVWTLQGYVSGPFTQLRIGTNFPA